MIMIIRKKKSQDHWPTCRRFDGSRLDQSYHLVSYDMKQGEANSKPPRKEMAFVLLFWAVSFILPPLTCPFQALGQTTYPTPQSLVQQGGYMVTHDNRVVLEHNSKKLFIPASILKLVTNLAALEILGPNYRFTTRFYLDEDNNLTIRGEGDPFLVAETITEIARELKKQGIVHIRSIILDDTAFALSEPADGTTSSTNPYDAVNGALVVNFNSLPLLVHKNGTVQSGEPQTPYLPLMREAGSRLQHGQYRINISSLANKGTISLPLRYAGELFAAIFKQEGIKMAGDIQQGTLTNRCRLVLTYQSKKTVQDMAQANLHFSNNFIANQLFLACGRQQMGFPATWDKARKVVQQFIRTRLLLSPEDIILVEGSGLSRKNRITAQAMIRILNHFKPYLFLLPLHRNTPVKTGTLSHVSCYAGYFRDGNQYDPFVLILNQKKNNRDLLFQILQNHYLTIKNQ